MNIQVKLRFYSAVFMEHFMIDLLNWFPPSLTLTDSCGFKIMKVIAHVKTGYAEDIMENNKCRNMHHGNALMANILNSMYRFRQMMPQCSCKHRNTCGQTPQQRSNHIAMLWVSHRQMVNKRDSPSMPMQHPLSHERRYSWPAGIYPRHAPALAIRVICVGR